MVPFFRGEAPPPIVDRERAAVNLPKAEVEEFRGGDRRININSTVNELDFEAKRISNSLSSLRQGELAFQPQRVPAPEAERMPRILPPTIDELRGAARPRLVDEGRVIPGSSMIKMRGETACVPKRTADSFKTNTAEDLLPTRGHAERHNVHPEQALHPTARGIRDSSWLPPAGSAASFKWSVSGSEQEKAPRYENQALPIGGAGRAGMWDAARDDSRSTYAARDNERNVSGGALPLIGAKAAPGTSYVTNAADERRDWNMKTLTTAAPRLYGNMRAGVALKGQIHDPNAIMRTTMKETMIHDTTVGIAGPNAERGPLVSPDSTAPLTIRNTLCDVDNNVNVAPGFVKPRVYDPNDVWQSTHRDTLDTERAGNVGNTPQAQGYITSTIEARTTQKQFDDDTEHFGIADNQNADGYKVAMQDGVAMTMRSVIGDSGPTFGPAGAQDFKATMSYADIYSATMRDTKEKVLQGRAPTNVGPKVVKGSQDPNLRVESNRDPYMTIHARPNGNVGRQGDMQHHNDPSFCEDSRAVNGLRVENDRFGDGLETAALRTNPYVQDITKN
jgi:hypothetical protein